MRLRTLLLCLPLLCACSSSSDGDDDVDGSGSDDPSEATSPTVDAAYEDLFTADATVPDKDELNGLWQLKDGPSGSEVRMQFADGQLRVGVKWGEALFGLTAEYEIDDFDATSPNIDFVLKQDVRVEASDGKADGEYPAGTFEISVEAGPARATAYQYNGITKLAPFSERAIELGKIVPYNYSSLDGSGTGIGISGGFRKIAD